jgi:hypothetical protein
MKCFPEPKTMQDDKKLFIVLVCGPTHAGKSSFCRYLCFIISFFIYLFSSWRSASCTRVRARVRARARARVRAFVIHSFYLFLFLFYFR